VVQRLSSIARSLHLELKPRQQLAGRPGCEQEPLLHGGPRAETVCLLLLGRCRLHGGAGVMKGIQRGNEGKS
jgi:hypothetical protein